MAISAKNQTLALLNDEHRSLAAVIHALQFLVRRMQEGNPANSDLLGAVLHYLTRFPERLHHPAEDLYLFAPLRAKTAESGEVLDLLVQEHGQGHQREGTTILPLAERLLSEAEWVTAAAGFAANADPQYGGDTAQDFKALFSRIVNQTPAPEGLGREET
jgi:hypothetical protein